MRMIYDPVFLTRHSHPCDEEMWLPRLNSDYKRFGLGRGGTRIEEAVGSFDLKSGIAETQSLSSSFRNPRLRPQIKYSPAVSRCCV